MNTVRALIFGGTSEGRELAEFASAHQIPVLVSVVSEYGESLLEENTYVHVRQGALDLGAMEALFLREAPELVLDATHPYARVVTDQVKILCGKHEIPYRRIVREETDAGACELQETKAEGEDIFWVSSPKEAVKLLEGDREQVLLTTGSKELDLFASEKYLKGRIFARVLPTREIMEKCERLGICGSHLIAMQGPFSEEMNRAILHQTGAKWLVTKESGSRGGFSEKVDAARNCGCRIIVIERPVREKGISLAEAKKLLEMKGRRENGYRKLSLIGMGMGGGKQLTFEAAEVLKGCDAVLGAPRMLEDVKGWCAHARREALYLADKILEWLEVHVDYRSVAVVYSGDTGFYSGSSSLLKVMQKRFGKNGNMEESGWKVEVYPGISSVSSLCARMQVPWDDMYLASAHGRSCDVAELMKHPRVFLLLGGAEGLTGICGKLIAAGYGNVKVTAGVRMGYPDERLLTGTAAALVNATADDLTAVVLETGG